MKIKKSKNKRTQISRIDFWRERPGNRKGRNGDWKKDDCHRSRVFEFSPELYAFPLSTFLSSRHSWLAFPCRFFDVPISPRIDTSAKKKEHLHFSDMIPHDHFSRLSRFMLSVTNKREKKSWMWNIMDNNSIY